ncbi:MAG: hypothetical protein RL065_1483 [Bacteroidota bacterium]|jgi:glyoxylase-like metal-dependent hydrolase (beta-lactamase superfamily II)
MKLHVIETGTFKLDGGAMFGVVPKKLWKNLVPPDENNLCTWALRCMLVEIDNRKILIDCGLGDKQDARFFSHYEPVYHYTLHQELKKLNLTANDITDVFLTHLHFDHCGGAIIRNEDGKLLPTFPNATYWSNEAHWKWATVPNNREKASFLKENILPIQESGLLKFVPVEKDVELYKGFKIKFAYGHTEAMMLPQLEMDGKTIVYMADLLPSAAHIPLPYVMGYDMRPLVTLQEKEVFLKEAAEKNYTLFFEHDNMNECATVKQSEKGIILDTKFALNDFLMK